MGPTDGPLGEDPCNRYGVRLVFDEIVCAFRTGRFLAAHHDPDVRPDAVVLATGLGAGYAPLGAFLVPATLVDELAETTGFVVSHSYDANPIACAAGSAVLDEILAGLAASLADAEPELSGRRELGRAFCSVTAR